MKYNCNKMREFASAIMKESLENIKENSSDNSESIDHNADFQEIGAQLDELLGGTE